MKEDKIMRIFISSTFREMKTEREWIQKDSFLKLRNYARKYGIFLIPVDLRWGISNENIMNGQLANICVNDVKKCSPNFIGIVGNSYGTIDLDINDKYSSGKSFTDLEICAFIDNDDYDYDIKKESSRFYFIVYSNYQEKNEDKKEKLAELKNKIRLSGLNIRIAESPENLIQYITNDVKKIIDEKFTLYQSSTDLDKSRELFNNILTAYYFSTEIIELTKNFSNKNGIYMFNSKTGVTCDFFIYNYADYLIENKKYDIIIFHDFSRTNYVKNKQGLIKHIIDEIHDSSGIDCEEDDTKFEYETLKRYLIQVVSNGYTMIILINSINIIEKDVVSQLLEFFNDFKKDITVIFSKTSSLLINDILAIDLPLLKRNDAQTFIINYLDFFFKNNCAELTSEICQSLVLEEGNDVSILYLLLEELTQKGCPTEEILNEIPQKNVISNYEKTLEYLLMNIEKNIISLNDIKQLNYIYLFEAILSFVDKYITKEEVNCIFNVYGFKGIHVDNSIEQFINFIILIDDKIYLRYYEIKKIIENSNNPFLNCNLENEIEKVYLAKLKTASNKDLIIHLIEELQNILLKNNNYEKILEIYFEKNVFYCLTKYNNELFVSLDEKYPYLDDVKKRLIPLIEGNCNCEDFKLILKFLEYNGKFDDAISIALKYKDKFDSLDISFEIGYIYRLKSDYVNSIKIMKRLYKAVCSNININLNLYLNVLDVLSYCYAKLGKCNAAMKYVIKSIDIREMHSENFIKDLPVSYNSIAQIYFKDNNYQQAIRYYEKALIIRKKTWNSFNYRVASNLNNIGECYLRSGEYEQAYSKYEEALSIFKKVLGLNHYFYAICEENLMVCQILLGKDIDYCEFSRIKEIINNTLNMNEYLIPIYFIDCFLKNDYEKNFKLFVQCIKKAKQKPRRNFYYKLLKKVRCKNV